MKRLISKILRPQQMATIPLDKNGNTAIVYLPYGFDREDIDTIVRCLDALIETEQDAPHLQDGTE